ncbi:MAG: hypothetical protein AAGD06_13175 [Acidobacteriota bacterium]
MSKRFRMTLACLCVLMTLPALSLVADDLIATDTFIVTAEEAHAQLQSRDGDQERQPEWVLFESTLSRALSDRRFGFSCTYDPCSDCDAEFECCKENFCDPGDWDCFFDCYSAYRTCVFTCP